MSGKKRVRGICFSLLLMAGTATAADEPPVATEPSVDPAAVESLAESANPVLLRYLLREEPPGVDESVAQVAVQQLITAQRVDQSSRAEAERKEAAAAAVVELLGEEEGRAIYGADFELFGLRIDAATALLEAEQEEAAAEVFVHCLEAFPIPEAQARCALGLAGLDPVQALERLRVLTESPSHSVRSGALLVLGLLAGEGVLPETVQRQAVEVLLLHTKGKRKIAAGEAAVKGLALSRSPEAPAVLAKLTKGMMNSMVRDDAYRALLISFGDRSVVPKLEELADGGGGFLDRSSPEATAFAGIVLLEAGEEAGYRWAREQLSRRSPSPDLRPQIIEALVERGDEAALRILAEARFRPRTWIQVRLAIALLELGDASRIEFVRGAAQMDEWPTTQLRAASALAAFGDPLGIGILEELYAEAARGWGVKLDLAVERLFGTHEMGDQRRLKQEVAVRLARLGNPAAIPPLLRMLDDRERSVAVMAAFGLLRIDHPDALDGMLRAVEVEYDEGEEPRSRWVWSRLALHAAEAFPEDPRTAQLLEILAAKDDPSLRLMARALRSPSTDPVVMEADVGPTHTAGDVSELAADELTEESPAWDPPGGS